MHIYIIYYIQLYIIYIIHIDYTKYALAGLVQGIECRPVNQRVTSSIPSQGTCLGCVPRLQSGAHKRQPHIDVSLPLFLPPFPSERNALLNMHIIQNIT